MMLFTMTCVMAAGVGIMQPVLPTLVAGWFADRPGFATAVYANGLLIGEAAPAVLTIPFVLPLVGESWPANLAFWAIPVAATAGLMVLCPDKAASAASASASPRAPVRWWPDLRRVKTWQLGLMLGGTGGLYFASNAFIPDYLYAIGRPDLVTADLGALNLGQLPASLLLLAMSRRLDGKAAIIGMQIVGLLGIAILLTAGPELSVIGAGVIGFSCASSLIITLALPPQLAAVADVHRLSAGMFAIGYTFSCLVPPVGGAIWDVTGYPAATFFAAAGAAAIVLAAALGFRFPPTLR
jgi:MFS transporter, CP family, cyanate transporter